MMVEFPLAGASSMIIAFAADTLVRGRINDALLVLGANLLLHSSVLLAAGLLLAYWAKRHSAVASATVLRAALLAVVLCPVASWMLREAGVATAIVQLPRGEYATLAALESHDRDFASAQEGVAAGEGDAVPPLPDERPSDTPGLADGASLEMSEDDRHRKDDSAGSDSLHRRDAGATPSPNVTPAAGAAPFAHATTASSSSPGTPYSEALHRAESGNATERSDRLQAVYLTLGICWIIGSALLLGRLLIAWLRLCRVRLGGDAAPPELVRECERLAAQFGVPAPRVLISDRIASPMLTGIMQPAILLPANDDDARSPEVLCHELAHLARRDCAWSLLAAVATSLLFYQPLLWLLRRCLAQRAEEVCDDMAVARLDRGHYARRLVDIAERCLPRGREAALSVGVVSFRSSLGRRVERIMDSARVVSVRVGRAGRAAIAIAAAGALMLAGLITAEAREEAPAPVASTQPGESSDELFVNAIADTVRRVLTESPPPFLTQADVERLPEVFREKLREYPPKPMSPERRKAILESFEEHVREAWNMESSASLQDLYLHFDQRVLTLMWTLSFATQREPMALDAKTRLEDQMEWMRAWIVSLAPESSAKRKKALDALASAVDDPLCPITQITMTPEQFAEFTSKVENSSRCKELDTVTPSLLLFAGRALFIENRDGIPPSGGLQPNGILDYQRFLKFSFPSRKGGAPAQIVLSVALGPEFGVSLSDMDSWERPSGLSFGDELKAWAQSNGHSGIGYDPAGRMGRLFGVGGTRFARLQAQSWWESDHITNDSLKNLLERYGRECFELSELAASNQTNVAELPRQYLVAGASGHDPVVLEVPFWHYRAESYMTVQIRRRPLVDGMFYTPGAVAAVTSRVPPAQHPAGTTGGPRRDNDASQFEDFKASFLDKSERDQRTTFYNECSRGLPEHVAWILDQHPEWANVSFKQGGSPLTLAQQPEMVELLLKRGATTDVVDRAGFTALHRAADAGDIARAKLLLEHGADINARHPKHGTTPLHQAVSEDERLNMVRFLIERGADLNVHAKLFDVTPVKLALILGFTSSAKVMADAGAELDLFSAAGLDRLDDLKALAVKTENPWAPDAATGLTPLHAAGLGGAVETTQYLIEQKLDVNAVSKPQIMNITPLTGAIIHAHPRTVKMLLDAGADPNLPGMRLQTPLTAVFAKRPDGSFPEPARMEIFDMLMPAGAKVTQETLMEAAQRADGEHIETLLARAAEIQQGTTDAGESEVRVIRLAEVNPKKASGGYGMPLHAAAATCNVEAVKVLLAAGADVHARGQRGMTPLNTWMSPERLSGRQRVAETMSLLLAAGADPNTQNDEGETPLHRAGSNGPLEAIRVLMLGGADPMIRDKLGRTAIDQASNPGAREVIQEHLAMRRKAVEEDVRGSLYWLLRQIADGTLADNASIHIRLEPPDWTMERWQREAERLNAAAPGRTVALMEDAVIEAEGDLAVAKLQPKDREGSYFFLILRRIDRQWFATRIGTSDASIPPGTHLLNARPATTNPATEH